MKKLIYIAIFLQLSISSLLLAGPGDPVYFADPNLQLAVEAELGIDDPNQIDMLGLTHLSVNLSEIFDLTGLEYATDVNELHLSNNLISDLSPISGLTSLIYLYLNGNQIIDISAVENLVNLDTLFLSINDVNDLSPVSGLIGLTGLYLSNNQISGDDISSLSGLSNLTVLDLTGNQVDDISDVPDLTSLEGLYLANNQIVDIPDMSSLTSLEYLYLTDNFIEDIFGLTGEEPNDLVSLLLTGNLLDKISYCTYLEMIKDNNPFLISIEVDDYPLDEYGEPTFCLDNDVCSAATEIFKDVLYDELTSDGATGIDVSNCGEGADELWDYNDVWHFYKPLSNEAVDISLCGSSFDTTLAVYDACYTSCEGMELACNDQYCGSQSLVTLELTAGVEYKIRVAGYGGDTGDYTLTIVNAPAPPVNNTCEDAIEIVPYTTVTGSTITAYGLDITSCTLNDTRDVWYKFIPTFSGLYLIDPNGSEYNATLAVFNDCEGPELVCNDLYCDYDYYGRCIDGYKSRIIVNLDEGVTYYIRISGYAGKGGNYSVTVTPAADIDKSGVVDIIDLSLLLQEWMMIDDEGDFIYLISDADIAFAEGMDDDAGSGGDKFINLLDFAVLCKQWQWD